MTSRISTAIWSESFYQKQLKIPDFGSLRISFTTHSEGTVFKKTHVSYNISTSTYRMTIIFWLVYFMELRTCFKYPKHVYAMAFRISTTIWSVSLRKKQLVIADFGCLWISLKSHSEDTDFKKDHSSYGILDSRCRMTINFLFAYSL